MTGERGTARSPRIPLHRSLVGRLLATSILIALAAVTATAWLAAQSTTRAIRQEQGRSLADDRSIYDLLTGYAATHRDWAGVSKVLQAKSAEVGRRISLTTYERETVAESGPGASLADTRPSATVDPLRLDQAVTGNTDTVDPRAVGPYRLAPGESHGSREQISWQQRCLQDAGVESRGEAGPYGVPLLRVTGPDPDHAAARCQKELRRLSADEDRALHELSRLTLGCLGLGERSQLSIGRTFSVRSLRVAGADRSRDVSDETVRDCVRESRLRQLRPYVAPPVLLFVSDSGTGDEPVFSLSRANVLRVVWVTAGVLAVTIVLTVLTGRRLVRPLLALTEAARTPLERPVPMPVSGDNEIAYLARALNDLTERRDRAEEQRRLMVSDVAHELRNPLTNIRAWLEAAQDNVVPTNHDLVDLLQDEAAVLRHVIDDLADLAAADAGSLRIHHEQVYVRDLLLLVGESHRGAAEKGELSLVMHLPDDLSMSADPVRLRQVVGNLLSNAIRYTPAGGTVALTTATTPEELIITVSDTGVGISSDDLLQIFERFWRADTSRARATGGSGLGLPIARKLVEAHGGTLTARSRPGEGTVMTVRLPLSP